MANYCDYEVHIRGTKKEALLFFATLPVYEIGKMITYEGGDADNYIIHVSGDCKWSLENYCTTDYDGPEADLSSYTEEDVQQFIENGNAPYADLSLALRSKLFHCEIQAKEKSEESQFSAFSHYKNGTCIMKKSIDYGEYVWHKDEYPDYEEYCEDEGIDPDEIPEDAFVDYGGVFVYTAGELNIKFDF